MSLIVMLDEDNAARDCFVRAAERVMETMFFDSLCGEPEEQDPGDGCHLARVVFRGSRMGWLEVALDGEASTSLAGNFLGLEQAPTREEAASTLAELSNMFCGAFLSLHDPRGAFEIGTPHVGAVAKASELAPVSGSLSRWHVLPISAGNVFWRLFWDDVC
jgi:hypothetical protein